MKALYCAQEKIVRLQDDHWMKDKSSRRKPNHPAVQATYSPLADIVASTVDNPSDSSVLDVGCGNGFLQWALEQRFDVVLGLDYCRAMLTLNPCRNRYIGDCTALPFVSGSIDVVVSSHVLHHLGEADRIQTLSEMRRVARKAVVSFEPNRSNPLVFLLGVMKPEERMAIRFCKSYMQRLFAKAGLFSPSIHVQGWVLPNKSPIWWIRVGRLLQETPLKRFGFDICCVAGIDM